MAEMRKKQSSAHAALQALAARQEDLVNLIEKLERHMTGVVLSQPVAPDPEVVETVQSLDLVRQSCGDTARLLVLFAEHITWSAEGPPSEKAMMEAVDMERSLDGLLSDTEDDDAADLPKAVGMKRDVWL